MGWLSKLIFSLLKLYLRSHTCKRKVNAWIKVVKGMIGTGLWVCKDLYQLSKLLSYSHQFFIWLLNYSFYVRTELKGCYNEYKLHFYTPLLSKSFRIMCSLNTRKQAIILNISHECSKATFTWKGSWVFPAQLSFVLKLPTEKSAEVQTQRCCCKQACIQFLWCEKEPDVMIVFLFKGRMLMILFPGTVQFCSWLCQSRKESSL